MPEIINISARKTSIKIERDPIYKISTTYVFPTPKPKFCNFRAFKFWHTFATSKIFY